MMKEAAHPSAGAFDSSLFPPVPRAGLAIDRRFGCRDRRAGQFSFHYAGTGRFWH